MLKQLLRRKNLDDILREGEVEEHKLKRALGLIHVVLLGSGAISGAGIFATFQDNNSFNN